MQLLEGCVTRRSNVVLRFWFVEIYLTLLWVRVDGTMGLEKKKGLFMKVTKRDRLGGLVQNGSFIY